MKRNSSSLSSEGGSSNSGWEKRARAKKRITKIFKTRLSEHLDATDRAATGRGFEAHPHEPKELDRNLRWLVRHQVGDENFTEIATQHPLIDPEGSGRRKVSIAVHKAAALISLSLRPPDTGAVPRK